MTAPVWIRSIQSLTRPLLTIGITAAFVWGWLQPERFSPVHLGLLNLPLLLVLGFWFGDRAIQRGAPAIGEMLAKRKST